MKLQDSIVMARSLYDGPRPTFGLWFFRLLELCFSLIPPLWELCCFLVLPLDGT